MNKIRRSELPEKCPSCGAKLKSYHESRPMQTIRICVNKCNGWHVVAKIVHADDGCFIDKVENKKPIGE